MMPDTMNLNVRISGTLKDFVSHEIKNGSYENVSEYVRNLIRRDQCQSEQRDFEHLKAELQLAFSSPDNHYIELSVNDILNNSIDTQ